MQHEPITKDNYFAAVTAFHQVRGGGKDGYPVISVKGQPDHWVAWMAYFDGIGLGWSHHEMRRLWNKGDGTWTVPAPHPSVFDQSFRLTDAEFRRHAEKETLGSEQTSAERKAFTDDLLRGFRSATPNASQEAAE